METKEFLEKDRYHYWYIKCKACWEGEMVTNRVVLHLKNKRVLKGKTDNFSPNKNKFHLELISGEKIEVQMEQLKAIFFVKTFDGDKQRNDSYDDNVLSGGRKIKVKFKDGETIIGFTTGYSPDRLGFFIVPADLKSNNERIYVVQSATKTIEMLQA